MGEVKLVIKQGAYPDELKKGEGSVVSNGDGTKGLYFACPKCGRSGTGPHRYDEKTQTLTPSIKCNAMRPENGKWIKCDYHGHLKEGVFDAV